MLSNVEIELLERLVNALEMIAENTAPLFRREKEKPEPVEDKTPINLIEIAELNCGIRIFNILNDGQWDSEYTLAGKSYDGTPHYCVTTVGQLKRIQKQEFLKHRNAGQMSWDSLQEYIKKLK